VKAVLPSQTDKPRFVAAMFGRIARRYDLMNTLMTAGQDKSWRRAVAKTVTRAPNAKPEYILDVGTGTGKLAQAVQIASPAARVLGVDFTLAMLRRAPRELQLAGADALRLPFADKQFDVVVSGFVMRNLANVSEAVEEQVRVLRCGGRLVVLETTPGPPGVLRPLFRLYFERCVPMLGYLIAGDASAYSYLPASTLAFLEPARLADVLRDKGLVDVQVQRLALGSIAVTSGNKPAMLRHTGGNT
jgi:demethylmenaquinone methyltransferase/2-methoxy-6-polyprenyl-1,4-benzoquinol methylase